ncbi:molybdate ABC transporter substrate-binding protein [Ureibacillus sinduriensis]|uniref:Molybdenum ABC transporter substrate-binding protein n=1 Tax=Ureibacillus sinduriensis BLB-1 = JCM 15800 TaxID=1384057 RepID=A0A0A3I1J3_9BACL|nr:molybdate ABC transporter substrate-binding protein [Ureibacillus sinduriensis]KGR78604.1 hypothetical protein CD33_01055 [Ureibacillus sinduriensis BLB-1 = JCM 15800]
MKQLKIMLFAIFLFLAMGGCAPTNPDKMNTVVLTVSAASSLQNVLEELAVEFQKKHSYIDIQYNFGASGALVKQIEQGAPADVIISASTEQFNKLNMAGLIQEGTTLISNELVLITGNNGSVSLQKIEDLKSNRVEKISIGAPSIVPAGSYAKQALEHLDLWTELESKFVYAKDVRQVLTYVESGNVQAGFVYHTDAIGSDKVKIISTINEEILDSISYPIGIVNHAGSPTEAKKFYEFLQSEEIKDIWVKYGFTY